MKRNIELITDSQWERFSQRIIVASYQYCVECLTAFLPCNQCECKCGGNVKPMIQEPKYIEYSTAGYSN